KIILLSTTITNWSQSSSQPHSLHIHRIPIPFILLNPLGIRKQLLLPRRSTLDTSRARLLRSSNLMSNPQCRGSRPPTPMEGLLALVRSRHAGLLSVSGISEEIRHHI